MIESLKIERFRNHKDTTLRFGPQLTAIAGPNGVGKSNALAALLDFSSGDFEGERFSERVKLELAAGLQKNSLSIHFVDSPQKTFYEVKKIFDRKSVCVEEQNRAPQNDLGSLLNSQFSERNYSDLESFMQGWVYLKPKPDNLSPTYCDSVSPSVGASGELLASVVTQIMTSDRIKFTQLMAAFREMIPSVVDIRSTREKITLVRKKTVQIDGRDIVYDEPDEVIGDSLLFDTKTANGLKADQMSEGTLLTLVILTALHQEETPRVLLIDDLDSGLHPSAQEEMVEILRKITEKRKDLQIVFTTHSPYILNRLKPDEINVLTADEDGYCRANLLSEHPKAEAAAKVMEPGELWSSVGESWVLDSVLK